MSKKTAIIIVVVTFLLVAIGVGVYLAMKPQTFFSSAQQTTTTTGNQGDACPAPGTPATVTLSYPLCEAGQTGETCQFDKAGCVWESVSSATSYNIKVTEVETGSVVKTESVTTLNTSFPVVQGRTYKCEVSAVSSCGSVGGTNEDTLLCEAEAFLSPTPTPTPVPVSTPPPATPAPTPVACGLTGCSTTVPCQAGFICIETSIGNNYCAKADYQSQCYRSPGQSACCQPPAPKPTLPPAGETEKTLIIGGAGLGLIILGAAALLLL